MSTFATEYSGFLKQIILYPNLDRAFFRLFEHWGGISPPSSHLLPPYLPNYHSMVSLDCKQSRGCAHSGSETRARRTFATVFLRSAISRDLSTIQKGTACSLRFHHQAVFDHHIFISVKSYGHITCPVPVRPFPRPSRSIRFGDVSEANGQGKPNLVPRGCVPFGDFH